MGLFSSSKASRGTSYRDLAGIATLGTTQISLTLLEKMMDGVPVPFIKAAAGTAVEVIKIAKAIQSNREECDELMKRSTSLLVVILSSFDGKTELSIPDHLRRGVERLTTNFHEVLVILRTIDRRTGKNSTTGIARAIVYYFDNTEKLKGCSAKLDWAMQEFQVLSKIDSCLKNLEHYEELRKGQEEIRDGQVDLQRGLTEVREAVREQILDPVLSLPSTVMPANPRIFGRQEYIENAVKLLLSASSSRLAILGPGGMGKTSVALKIVHDSQVFDRFTKNRHWIACEQATSVTLLVELLAKSLKLPASKSNDRFDDVITALESSDVPHLFLLDNFETPWDIDGQRSAVGDVLTRIGSIPFTSFILTMRGNQQPYCDTLEWSHPPLPSLAPLEPDPAQEAFLKISPESSGDPELHTLLSQLDCIPLAITLMAKLARGGESISQLLSQWGSERTRLLDEPGGDRRTSIEVSVRLSLESRSVKGSKDAIRLLGIISMLPGGAAINRLPDICPSISTLNAALRVLLGAALIYHSLDKSFVQVLSPIRSYVLLYHYPEQGPLQDLRDSYYRLAQKGSLATGKPDFAASVKDLVNEESNMDAILLDVLQEKEGDKYAAISAAIDYSVYLRWTQPRTNIIYVAAQVARTSRVDQHARCLLTLGTILGKQDQFEASNKALEEAKTEFTNLGDHIHVASCLVELGDNFRYQAHYEAAYSAEEEAKSVYINIGDRIGAAHCLRAQGTILERQSQYETAYSAVEEARFEYTRIGSALGIANCLVVQGHILQIQTQFDASHKLLEEAKTNYINVGNRRGAARSLREMAQTFLRQSQYDTARNLLEEARLEFTNVGLPSGIATCLIILGEVLLCQAHYEGALALLEETKSKCLGLGDHLGVATCQKILGEIHCQQSRYEEAHSLLEGARSQYINLGSRLGVAKCLRSLGDTLSGQTQYEAAQSKLEEAKSQYISLGDRLGAADCLHSLGEILRRQTKFEAASVVIGEARSEYSRLGNRLGLARCMRSLGNISRGIGKDVTAREQLEEAKLYAAIGHAIGPDECDKELDLIPVTSNS